MNSARFDVLIVGGGFSGTIVAIQLLYRAPALKIALLDKGSLPGRGVAYGANYKRHFLTLPADMMSAFSEEPNISLSELGLITGLPSSAAVFCREPSTDGIWNRCSSMRSQLRPKETLRGLRMRLFR